MAVIGMRFHSIEGKREKGKSTPRMKINSSPKIRGVKETNVPSLDKKILSVDFDFVTEYTPENAPDTKIGSINFSGELFYLAEKNAEVIKGWKDKKELPDGMRVEVMNHLFRACLLKIASMADDLQLPLPIAVPRMKPKESGK
jgi:hypothetical protein